MQCRNVHCLRFPNLERLAIVPRLERQFLPSKLTQVPCKNIKRTTSHLNPNLTALFHFPERKLEPYQRERSQLYRQQEHSFSWFMHKQGEHDSCHGSDDSRSMNTQPTLQSWP